MRAPVGAGLLAMNDYAVTLKHRVGLIASKPAPAKSRHICANLVQPFTGARFRA
jgi:hypothetical protein